MKQNNKATEKAAEFYYAFTAGVRENDSAKVDSAFDKSLICQHCQNEFVARYGLKENPNSDPSINCPKCKKIVFTIAR
jgi:DNA-directed RNA polymerase subunit RPC12/RpoP